VGLALLMERRRAILGHMLPRIDDEIGQAIEQSGTPLAVVDDAMATMYMLLPIDCLPDPAGGVLACVPGIDAFGSGDTNENAALALMQALRSYLEAFS